MAATLLGASMNPDTWLQTIIAPLPSKPSLELQRFFSSCDRDVTTEVLRRADIILEAIFPSCGPEERSLQGSLMDNVWAEQRRLEAMKLYYKVLNTICMVESKVLPANNLTSLLTNDRFHRCLLACSAELILATHSTVPMLFPAVFERTGITAFDLIKVIESFIRHEVSLPRELRRHLNSLEEQFLECIAWEKGSSLYNTLLIARPNLSAEIDRLGLQAGPMPSLCVIAMHMNMPCVSSAQKDESAHDQNEDLRSPKRSRRESQSVLVERHSFTSPVKNHLLALKSMKPGDLSPVSQSTISSSTGPSPCGREETCADKAITKFFGKIVKLAAVRINAMVERLQYSQQMRDTIYVFFQKILNERTVLFFNRHIDQIILCCFYGVAKILQLNPTFAEFFSSYRKQPQWKPQVLSGVYIYRTSGCGVRKIGHDHIPMFHFYNQVFILAVKSLLDELTMVEIAQADNRGAEAGMTSETQIPMSPKATAFPSLCYMSPKATPFPSLPDMSPKKVSAAHNVYVSPMRASKMETLMSCSGGSYYAFVGETTQPYQSPSKDLNAINNHLKCTRKARRALNFDNFRGQFISDSLVEL